MLNQLLARFGVVLIDTDTVAQRLAGDMLRLWGSDLHQLAESVGKTELQRKYLEIALATGLPGSIARQVADRAWHYIAQAQRTPVVESREGFSFYQ